MRTLYFRRSLHLLSVLLFALVMAWGCSGEEPSDSPDEAGAEDGDDGSDGESGAGEGGTLNVVIAEGPIGFDPNAASSVEFIAIKQVAEQLIVFDPADLNFEPELAESFEQLDDQTWEFTLREGIEFSNGDPFDAEAVKYSLERTVDPDITSQSGFDNNMRYEQLGIDSIDTPDDHTVVINLEEPNPLFLSRLADDTVILSPSMADLSTDEVQAGEIIGTGPFVVAEFERDSFARYEANDNYWGEGPFVDEVTVREVQEGSSRAGELEAGSADVAVQLPPESLGSIEGDDELELVTSLSPRKRVIMMRTNDSHYEDVRVRKAMIYGIDRQAIVDSIFGGHGEVMASVVNPPFADESLEPYPYDPDRAVELLEEAGYPDGFEDTLYFQSGDPLVAEAMQAIQAHLGEIGVELDLQPQERAVHRDALVDNSMTLAWWDQGFYGDGGRDMGALIDGTFAMTQYGDENPEFLEKYEEQKTVFDNEQRQEMITELEHTIYEDVPYIPLWRHENLYGVRSSVEGFEASRIGRWSVGQVRITD